MKTFTQFYQSPIGILEIKATEQVIQSILFVDKTTKEQTNPITKLTVKQLKSYFDGKLQTFDLPLGAQGTEFQKNVWKALCSVKFGKTATYRDIANIISNPKAVRAVGAANGCNPLTIVVPCHRIIGSDGSLTGYASGVDRKRWLLDHELKFK